MREFTKSLFSFSLAMSFFGLQQMDNMLRFPRRGERKGPAIKSFDSLTAATTAQFGTTLEETFRAIDGVQRGLIGWTFKWTFNLMLPFFGLAKRSLDLTDAAAAQGRSEAVTCSASEPRRWTEVMATLPAEGLDREPMSSFEIRTATW